jgi:moderate conductance mechanosensitive channel
MVMNMQLSGHLDLPVWVIKVAEIGAFFLAAWIAHRLASRFAKRLVGLGRFARQSQRPRLERQLTLQGLFSSAISVLAMLIATLASVGLFVRTDTLVWMVGLFSAAFGLGARPLVNDLLSGISFIFEDSFMVGEKVELLGVEGVVEAVNLRTTLIRAPSGELYIVPNGEIRLVRNFSRGRFSTVHVRLKLRAVDLDQALTLLEIMGEDAVSLLPNLLEPWQVRSESETIGQLAELSLIARARFGQAAEMRPRLLSFVQQQLAENNIDLVD